MITAPAEPPAVARVPTDAVRTAPEPAIMSEVAQPVTALPSVTDTVRTGTSPAVASCRPAPVRLVAGLTAAAGVLSLLATLRLFSERGLGRLNRVVNPFEHSAGTAAVGVAVGIGLLYLAGNLARGKRAAWLVALGLFGVATIDQAAHLVTLRHVAPAVVVVHLGVPVLMVALLLATRAQFTARPDPPSLLQFLRFVPVYLVAVVTYGVAALRLMGNALSPPPTFLASLRTVLQGLVGVDGEYTYRGHLLGVVFPTSLALLGLFGLVVSVVLVFRPLVARPRTEADWHRADELVRRYGHDTLSYFALRHDKSFFFSSDGRAMIAYAYLGRYALVSGDPIGHPEAIDLVIDEFRAHCRDHGWGCAFLAVREDGAGRYRQRGLRTLYLGDEAVIDCSRFTLEGKRNKSMRQSVARVARTHRFELLDEADASPALVDQLNALSDRWRGKAPERGFTMALSRPVRGVDRDFKLCVAFDGDGVPRGFLRIVPVFGDEPGYTLDMMRRDPTSTNGLTEFLIANTAFALRDGGMGRLSLNFAVMGRLYSPDLPFTLGERLARRFLSLLNPFFQIKSLHDFNRRFRPDWVPRVIVYEDQRSLPRVALLYSGAEGFLSLPVLGRFLVPPSAGDRLGR